MRIVQACPYSWEAPGGVQTHVRQLAGNLEGRGHRVLILAPGRRRAGAGVVIVGRPVRVPYNGSVVPICPSPVSVGTVARALARFGPDVVHVHEPFAPSTAMFAVLKARAPVVATFHAYADRALLFTLAAPFLRPVWRRLDVRLAVSEAAASFVRARLGDGIRVVPNGVDVAPFEGARPRDLPPGRRVLFVSRLDRRKGFRVALRAFARLAPDFPDLLFVVVGDGEERAAVRDLPELVRRRVILLGAVSHEELPSVHAAADVFVAPALGGESFGIVLVEAMASGLPVVASDIPGYREVVRRGVEGHLVPPGDAGAVADALRRVLTDPGLARRLGEAGRARARQYSWERVAGQLEAIYEEARG